MFKQTTQRLCTLLVMLLCLACAPLASAAGSEQVNLISVDGTGSSTAMPDKAVITVGITNFATEAGEAQQENARLTTAVMDALRAGGIAAKDMETRSYSFSPARDNDNQTEGYRVNNSILVTVREVSRVGTVIDTALANGATNISCLNFSLQQPEALRRTALKNAIADARLKADIIAEALGVRITGIKLVTENVGNIYERDALPMLMSNRAGKASLAETPIAASEVEVSANVHIDYIISQ